MTCRYRRILRTRNFLYFYLVLVLKWWFICNRFKKGNLRLLQTEDGGWKLEELEEKRRSLDGGGGNSSSGASPRTTNASFEEEGGEGEVEVRERAASSGAAEAPAKTRKDRRKKSSQGSEEVKGESQLLRR